jgi:hypothetical protein
MKTMRNIVLAALVLAGCGNPAGPGVPPGMGLARIRLEGAGPRTVVSDISGYYFTLTFSAAGKADVGKTVNGSLTLTAALEPGTWDLAVKGYSDAARTNLMVTGTARGTVTLGAAADFAVVLAGDYRSGGTGSLAYSISFPAGARGILSLRPLDVPGITDEAFEDIDISSSVGGIASATIPDLPAGAYLAAVDLYDAASNKAAVWTRGLRIYDKAEATLSHAFTLGDDFAECPPVVGTGALAAKLDTALLESSGTYTVVLEGDETNFTPKTLNVTSGNDITIIIRGNGSTIQRSGGNPLFTVKAASGTLRLILQDLTLTGVSTNPLVLAEAGGTLEMKAGSHISGNTSGNGVAVNGGSFTMDGGAVSGNGGGVFVQNGGFTMHGGAVSGNSAGVGVVGGSFTMDGGAVSGNSTDYGGGGVVVYGGTFTMNGGAVSGNSAATGGGVAVVGGTFAMSGGAVSGNLLSNEEGIGKEVMTLETITLSGDARPERVFLYQDGHDFGSISIGSPLAGGPIAVDLGIVNGSPITAWEGKPILQGNLASKDLFVLGDMKRTDSPDPAEPITGYKIADDGKFAAE